MEIRLITDHRIRLQGRKRELFGNTCDGGKLQAIVDSTIPSFGDYHRIRIGYPLEVRLALIGKPGRTTIFWGEA
jgi:hypothetical protein